MYVTVYKQEFFFPVPQGSASAYFEITGIIKIFKLVRQSDNYWKKQTETLNGRIIAVQNKSRSLDPHYVSTGEETHVMVKFHDPEHFLNQAQDITYYWFVNEVNYGITKEPLFKYNFNTIRNIQRKMALSSLEPFKFPNVSELQLTQNILCFPKSSPFSM